MVTMKRHLEALQPYLTPLGTSEVGSEGAGVQQTWGAIKTSVSARTEEVAERQADVRNFWNTWDGFEKWLVRTQREADQTREMYSDEMPAYIAKIEVRFR